MGIRSLQLLLFLACILASGVITSPTSYSSQNVFLAPENLVNSPSQEIKIERAVRYDGYRLLRFSSPLTAIPLLEEMSNHTIDIWSTNTRYSDILVSPSLYDAVRQAEFQYEVLMDNVQTVIDKETEILKQGQFKKSSDPVDWFTSYHTYDDIVEWYQALAKQFPNLIEFIPSIGKTHEKRDIIAVKVTNRNAKIQNKSQFWIQGNQHAREWIGGATAQYITYQLLNQFDVNQNVTYLLNIGEFIIIPCMNPDGYTYTWESDRLWRKNRRRNGNGAYGVDLNRNWPANWGRGGSSGFPFSETYRGPKAASEPEVQALSKFFLENENIIVGLDLHSYSQLILRPLGWSKDPAPHEKQHKQVGDDMADIIYSVHGKRYVSEPSISLYATTGSASDWFYIQKRPLANKSGPGNSQDTLAKAKEFRAYGITIELRPTPEWWGPGFVLPPEEIIPTGEEIFPAIMHLMSFALENVLTDKNADE